MFIFSRINDFHARQVPLSITDKLRLQSTPGSDI